MYTYIYVHLRRLNEIKRVFQSVLSVFLIFIKIDLKKKKITHDISQ